MKAFSSKRKALKVDVMQSQKTDYLQGCPCTLSAEMLQAGAVKGLNVISERHRTIKLCVQTIVSDTEHHILVQQKEAALLNTFLQS